MLACIWCLITYMQLRGQQKPMKGNPNKSFAFYSILITQTEDAVENAVKLDGSTFKDRVIKVTHKRVNDPNFYYTQDTGGGRGRGRGGFRGGRGGGAPGRVGGGFRGGRGARRGGFRGGGRGGRGGGGGYGGGGGGAYHPYY